MFELLKINKKLLFDRLYKTLLLLLLLLLLPLLHSWRRSIVVRTLVAAGELSLSCARLLAGCVTTFRLRRPLSVSQHGQLSHPSLRGR